MANIDLANYLRYLRKQRKLKQDDVAKQLGVKRAAYSHYECGVNMPPTEQLSNLAAFYGIPFSDFSRFFDQGNVSDDINIKDNRSVFDKLNQLEKEYLSDEAKKLPRGISGDEGELIYYFRKLSGRDKKMILMNMKFMMIAE